MNRPSRSATTPTRWRRSPQLLGARWGASAVPLAWRTLLHGWPGYHTRDLIRLAILSACRGQADRAGWPVAQSLVPYYRDGFGAHVATVALTEDPGVLIGDAAAVTDHGCDIVVSLCRMGRADVGASVEHHELWLIDEADPATNPNLDFMLTDVAAAIVRWRSQGRSVLVHCARAESRSPTVAAAYLAQHLGISGAEALERASVVLPALNPNPGFRAALKRLWP